MRGMMKPKHSWSAALAAAALSMLVVSSSAVHAQTTVSTETGPVRGMQSADGRSFLGIPYAAAPVGSLRWKPPAAAARWRSVRDATSFGSSCPQPATPFGLASQNEDCLFLNVYTPVPDEDNQGAPSLPVMVWLHPGAFQFGEGDDFVPSDLVQQGV